MSRLEERDFNSWIRDVMVASHEDMGLRSGPVMINEFDAPEDRVISSRLQLVHEGDRVTDLIFAERQDAHEREKMGKEGQTKESKKKRRPDMVHYYISKGKLTKAHDLAAKEIMRIFEALQRSNLALVRYEPRLIHENSRGRHLDVFDRLSEKDQKNWRDRYRPWSRRMSELKHGDNTYLAITFDMIGDNASAAGIAKFRHMKKEKVVPIIATALAEYCQIAGIPMDQERTHSAVIKNYVPPPEMVVEA